MSSRMERYSVEDEPIMSRAEKNQEIYSNLNDSTLSRVKTNSNVSIIDDAPKEIDIDKIKKYVESINKEKVSARKTIVPNFNSEEPVLPKEEKPKVYDINSVLEKARRGREINYEEERYRKLKNTQYDILAKIKVEEPSDEEELPEDFNTDERTIIDLINTVTIHNGTDLFSDLKSDNEDTIIMKPIEEEANNESLKSDIENIKQMTEFDLPPLVFDEEPKIEKIEGSHDETLEDKTRSVDTSFFTNSLSFGKADFEGIDELERSVNKNNSIVRISLVLLILLGLATVLVILHFVLDIKIF